MKSIPVVVWKSNSSVTHCLICEVIFSLFKRKHHCRYCGEIICDKCSLNRIQIYKSQGAVRICDQCVSIQFGRGTYNDKNNDKHDEKLNVKIMTNNICGNDDHNVNVAIDDGDDDHKISITHNATIGSVDSRDGMNVWKSPVKTQHNNSSDLFTTSILSIYSLDDYYIRLRYDDHSTIHSIIDQLQSLIKISIHIGIFELCQIEGGSKTFHPISLHVRIIDLFDEWRNVYSMHNGGNGIGAGSSGSSSASNRILIYNDSTHIDNGGGSGVVVDSDSAVVLKMVIPLYYKNLYPSAMMDNVHDSYRQSMHRYRQPPIEIENDPLHDADHHCHDINNNGVPTRDHQLILASLTEKQQHEYNKNDDDDDDDYHHHFDKHECDNQNNTNCDTTWISIDSCADQVNNINHINYRSHHHRINSAMKHNDNNTNSKSFELLTTLSNHIQPIDHEDDDSNSSVESSSPAKILMNLQEFSIHENRRRSSGQFSGHSPVRTSLATTTRRLSNPVFYSR